MIRFMADTEKYPRTDCSTIIVGKNATTTGRVLVGHNEDDPGCMVQSHLVPRMQHAEGETVRFADGTAVIDQVPETCAYYWSEFRSLNGEAFAEPLSMNMAYRWFPMAVWIPSTPKVLPAVWVMPCAV